MAAPAGKDDSATAPELPVLSEIPALTRRRFSKLTKLAFDVALRAISGRDDSVLPTVFASRHGDLHKTFALLQQLAAKDALSPTQFALSVHNAISGQFSLHTHNQSDSSAIAGGPDSLHYALLEAYCRFISEPELTQLLVVYADEPVPDLYQPACQDPSVAVALALLLSRNQGQKFILQQHNDIQSHAEGDQVCKLIAFLHSDVSELCLAAKGRKWLWTRSS